MHEPCKVHTVLTIMYACIEMKYFRTSKKNITEEKYWNQGNIKYENESVTKVNP